MKNQRYGDYEYCGTFNSIIKLATSVLEIFSCTVLVFHWKINKIVSEKIKYEIFVHIIKQNMRRYVVPFL